MTGGGFGGCVLALVDAPAAPKVAEAVVEAFASQGFATPSWFTASAGPGASRLD
jgi:galactokinase